jgi:hypothetical protein
MKRVYHNEVAHIKNKKVLKSECMDISINMHNSN